MVTNCCHHTPVKLPDTSVKNYEYCIKVLYIHIQNLYHETQALASCFAVRNYLGNDSAFLSRATNKLSQQPIIEKAYLHLDKPYYAAGDDIWFKAYVTAGGRHKLSAISGILNVELINAKNRIEQSVKLPLVSGLTWGDFRLPDTMKAGYYRIRAYTLWMRNAGSEYFYDKTLYIGNAIAFATPEKSPVRKKADPKETSGVKEKSQSAKISIQFFPESGTLVYGINSIVAFKAVGEDGLGKSIKGVITDENNDEIARFSSRHLGMGEFNLLPVSGKKYKALITFADGSEKGIDLPVPQVKGYVLHVDNTDPLFIEVKIEAGKNSINEQACGGINLLGQSGGEIYYAAQSKSQQSFFTTMIPKSKFPTGIAQFTLFSATGEPLNERLVFIQNPARLNLSIDPGGTNFATRGRMKINVGAKNEQGKPVFGNFSAAVIDETKVPVDELSESTIFSNLLLTSDLKGYIENPNYYFDTQSEQAKEDLDVLMLTQGYRRFEWRQIMTDSTTSPKYQPETSLGISGRLTTLGGGKGIPQGKVSLLSSSQGFAMLDTVADEKGYFSFRNLQFKDSSKFVIQAKKNKDSKNLRIEMDNMSTPPVTASIIRHSDPDSSFAVYLDNSKQVYDKQIKYGMRNRVKTLKEVQIKDKKVLSNSSNLNGPGNADQVFLMKDVPGGCATVAECLIGRLTNVFFKYNTYKDCYFPCTYRHGTLVDMKIMVDGIIMDFEVLATLPPDIVESVEVLRNGSKTSLYGSDGSAPLLLINTKKGAYSAVMSTNIVTYMPQGYYKAREFYSPDYNVLKNKPTEDLRTTIYWNPNVATNKDGNATLEYFNADARGTYRVVIEGIDENGNLGRQVYRYKAEAMNAQ